MALSAPQTINPHRFPELPAGPPSRGRTFLDKFPGAGGDALARVT